MKISGMCGIQWSESAVTGTQNAFDLSVAIVANAAKAAVK